VADDVVEERRLVLPDDQGERALVATTGEPQDGGIRLG